MEMLNVYKKGTILRFKSLITGEEKSFENTDVKNETAWLSGKDGNRSIYYYVLLHSDLSKPLKG